MLNPRLAHAQQELGRAIDAFNEVLSDCTAEELLGARVIVQILADAQLRMDVLGERLGKRAEGKADQP